jgi:hypothetical protein
LGELRMEYFRVEKTEQIIRGFFARVQRKNNHAFGTSASGDIT